MPFDITEAIYDPATGKVTVKGYAENAQDQWNIALFTYADVANGANVSGTGTLVNTYTAEYGSIKTDAAGNFEVSYTVYGAGLTGEVYVYGKYVEVTSAADAERVKTYLYFDKNAEDAVDGATTEVLVYIGDEIIPALTKDEPTRANYDFGGWRADAAGTAIADGTVMSYAGYTAYAAWNEHDQYTVSFESGEGGSLSGTTVYTVYTGTEWSEITVPTVEADYGYEFIGWDKSFPETVTESAVYVAQFAKVEELWHSVRFEAGVGGSLSGTVVYTDILRGTAWDEAIASVPEAVAQDGYTFKGWNPHCPKQ